MDTSRLLHYDSIAFWIVHSMAVLTLASSAMAAEQSIRIATYNASLFGQAAGEIHRRLGEPTDAQAKKIAAVVQTVRPDILLINELDYDPSGNTAKRLAENYFAVADHGRQPIHYPHVLAVPSNTGIDSRLDLNRNGQTGDAEDAWGFGKYPGQYAMAIFSRYPIDRSKVRTFQQWKWKDLPAALRPINPETHQPYYPVAVWESLRLSSKNHVSVPLMINQGRIHLLASHPTPPVFDGPEDHNGCRNHDEIRFWIDFLSGAADHLVDDLGVTGGLPQDEWFVIAGDLNSDPAAGDSRRSAIRALLNHSRVQDPHPRSEGAAQAAADVTNDHAIEPVGDPSLHTAAFEGGRHLRIDYVLPCRELDVIGSGVFWPTSNDPDVDLLSASDHRLVWIEVNVRE